MRNAIRLVVLVPLLACASIPTDEPYMPNASSLDREVAIKGEFQQRATDTLTENNVILDREVADELRLLWQMAARRLVEDNASRSEVARAVNNVSRIVLTAAGSSPSAGATKQITVEGYERAKLSLCPGFYPFC